MSDVHNKAVITLSEAIIALLKDPKKSEAMVEEAKKNFAVKDDILKKYNEALDTIAEAKKLEGSNKQISSTIAAQQNELSDNQTAFAKTKSDFDKETKQFKEAQDNSKAYEVELKTLSDRLASQELSVAAKNKALDDRSAELDNREKAVASREAVFKQAAGLIA